MASDTPLQCHEGRKQMIETVDLDSLCPSWKIAAAVQILTTLDMGKFRSGVSGFCKRSLMDFSKIKMSLNVE